MYEKPFIFFSHPAVMQTPEERRRLQEAKDKSRAQSTQTKAPADEEEGKKEANFLDFVVENQEMTRLERRLANKHIDVGFILGQASKLWYRGDEYKDLAEEMATFAKTAVADLHRRTEGCLTRYGRAHATLIEYVPIMTIAQNYKSKRTTHSSERHRSNSTSGAKSRTAISKPSRRAHADPIVRNILNWKDCVRAETIVWNAAKEIRENGFADLISAAEKADETMRSFRKRYEALKPVASLG